ncbi:MAG: D-alanine--D-alanine ligase [Deltaproteobacteria bacterium]|nr:D-alanine--D-alanine ligase [Deltaproteobacteria bacterium]
MKRRRILALCHREILPPEGATDELAIGQVWKMEHHVLSAVRELGHELEVLGIDDDLRPIRDGVERFQPDVVLNLLEAFAGEVLWDQNVVSYLELLGASYTGCDPRGLVLSRDKALSKKLAAWHRVRVPDFFIVRRGRKVRRPARMGFPLIVKSPIDDASLGIAKASIVHDDDALAARIDFMRERWDIEVMAEEFIPGRELYVGVLGNDRLTVLPTWELVFEKKAEDQPLIATRKAKWDVAYQEKLGIQSGEARDLPEEIARRLPRICRRLYRALGLSGYARLDFRLSKEGVLYFLEANPNPDISRDEDLAVSAARAGLPYPRLIQRILDLGRTR